MIGYWWRVRCVFWLSSRMSVTRHKPSRGTHSVLEYIASINFVVPLHPPRSIGQGNGRPIRPPPLCRTGRPGGTTSSRLIGLRELPFSSALSPPFVPAFPLGFHRLFRQRESVRSVHGKQGEVADRLSVCPQGQSMFEAVLGTPEWRRDSLGIDRLQLIFSCLKVTVESTVDVP